MTPAECFEAIERGVIPASCVITTANPLGVTESLAVIISAIAIVVTCYVGFEKLKALVGQIENDQSNHDETLDSNRTNARLVETLNLLVRIQTNPTWRENRQQFVKIRDSKDIAKHAMEETVEAIVIRQQLNQYELIALGIANEIVDYDMYREYYRGTVLRDWDACMPFISDEREENAKYWVQLEGLVARFRAED